MEEMEAAACGPLPPQEPLGAWLRRGVALASQTGLLLQQLLWLLHCCPEDLQNTETPGLGPPTPRCLTPLADHRQPAGCLMRRGDAAWLKASSSVEELLDRINLKVEGGGSLVYTGWETLLDRLVMATLRLCVWIKLKGNIYFLEVDKVRWLCISHIIILWSKDIWKR